MTPEEINGYISALADKEISGITDEEIAKLQQLLDDYPSYFGEYQLDLATKLCLIKHSKPAKCPEDTQNNIRHSLLRILHSIHSAH